MSISATVSTVELGGGGGPSAVSIGKAGAKTTIIFDVTGCFVP